MHSIEARNISKNYKQISALKNIRFQVAEGEIFGFIGPDGAGKTSLFRILATLLLPDSGQGTVCNYDIIKDYKKIRQIVGYMPGKFSLYQDLSVEENLEFFASVFGVSVQTNYYLIKDIYTHIEAFKKRRAGHLSGGMKQKLALCCALIHKPKVLFLDEPTTGIDAVSRKEFWNMLKGLKNEGITILVSTPYMDEASLCDRVALIQHGKIMKTAGPSQIISDFKKQLYVIRSQSIYRLINDLEQHPDCHTTYPFGQEVHFVSTKENLNTDALKAYLEGNNHIDIDIKLSEPTIEDCFMELMNK